MNTPTEQKQVVAEPTRVVALVAVVILYILLFFRASHPGLNWFCLAVISASIPYFIQPRHKWKHYFFPSTALIISGFAVFLFVTPLSIIGALFSFWFLAARLIRPNIDPGLGSLLGLFNHVISPIGTFVRLFQRLQSNNTRIRKAFTHLIIPGILILVFGTLYYHSSPTFQLLLDRFQWREFPEFLFNLLLASFFAFVLLYSFIPKIAEKLPFKKSDSIVKSMGGTNLQTSWQIGVWSLVLLLGIVVISDFYYKMLNQVPEGLNYSSYLHQGVFSLVVSIVFSALISVLTSNYTSSTPSRGMQAANYGFLSLNFIFVWQNIFRNYAYISEYGLTEKRVIIYFYLLACIIGLLLTFYTIYQNKSISSLYTSCAYVVFSMIVLTTPVNWSAAITQYNINHPYGENQEIDTRYLLSLNRSNSAVLYQNISLFDSDQRIQIQFRARRYLNYNPTDFRELNLGSILLKNDIKSNQNILNNETNK